MSSRYASSTPGRSSKDSTCSNYLASPGLPGDEFKVLKKMQDRSRLEAHFRHSGSSIGSGSARSRTSYQSNGVLQDKRVHISEVKYATRAALGKNFDFTDVHEPQQQGRGRRRYDRYDEPVPQKYIDEYHQWCREDDKKYDGAAYRDDYTYNAPARMHEPIAAYKIPMRRVSGYDKRPASRSARVETGDIPVYEPPQLTSKFSFDSESGGGEKKRGSLFSLYSEKRKGKRGYR